MRRLTLTSLRLCTEKSHRHPRRRACSTAEVGRIAPASEGNPHLSGYAGFVILKWGLTLFRRGLALRSKLLRRGRSARLKARWDNRDHMVSKAFSPKLDPDTVFDRLDVVVINLDSRPDRLQEFSDEAQKLGLTSWRRFSAVDGRQEFPDLDPFYSGSIGCSLSHVYAFGEARWDSREALLVCEDDVEFLVDKATLAAAIHEFLDEPNLDVLALYGRARGGSHHISDTLRIVVGLVGTVCYVVKPHMAEVIGDLFTQGVDDLKSGKRKGKSDILWNRLQKNGYFFAAPITTYARNREGFSDIEGRMLGPR